MSIPITEFRNAISLQEDNLVMDVEINHPKYGWIPYTLNHNDRDTTINNYDLFSLIGNDFTAYVPPPQSEVDAKEAEFVREERDFLLEFYVDRMAGNTLRWNALTDEQRAAWTQYRTDLLNISNQAGFPHDVTWPTKPEE
jgi:hypothetical protein